MRALHLAWLAPAAVLLLTSSDAFALGFGADAAAVDAAAGPNGDARGIFARVGLIGPLEGEIALARVNYDDVGVSERKLAVGLHLDVITLGKWTPFLAAATGVLISGGADNAYTRVFDELGGGIAYHLVDRLRIEVDYRQGHVEPAKDQATIQTDVIGSMTTPDEYQSVTVGLAVSF